MHVESSVHSYGVNAVKSAVAPSYPDCHRSTSPYFQSNAFPASAGNTDTGSNPNPRTDADPKTYPGTVLCVPDW